MSVDFPKNQPQNRGIDEGLGLLLYLPCTIARKVVGIKKLQQIAERRKFGITRFLPSLSTVPLNRGSSLLSILLMRIV